MTYGWALILIATIVGVFVFIVSTPASQAVFSSSDPTKIMVKAANVEDTTAKLKMQNITGGKIEITSVSLPGGYSPADCSLNAEANTSLITSSNTVTVMAGGEIFIECSNVSDATGEISIDYTDYASLSRNVKVTGAGGAGSSQECGDGSCTGTENPISCPGDCPAVYPDGFCSHSESAYCCPADCAAVCGDSFCTHEENNPYSPEYCPTDCP